MSRTIPAAAALGAATGLRSTSGFAILASTGRAPRGSHLASERTRRLLAAALLGEAVADKTLDLPARTDAAPLLGRAVLGGAAAAVASSWAGASRARAAVVGAACAVVTAWAATRLRSAAVRRGAPDAAPALAEDVVVLALAHAADRLLG